jgi:hypothetical protein
MTRKHAFSLITRYLLSAFILMALLSGPAIILIIISRQFAG